MNMRLRVSTLPSPAPAPPPPQEVISVHQHPLASARTVAMHVALPQQLIVSEDTQRKVERIKALARAQPGASPLAIMGALA